MAGCISPRVGRARQVVLCMVTLIFSNWGARMSHANTTPHIKNVALVHGGFVDGSGWDGVYQILEKRGFNVSVVQNSTVSLANDVAGTKRALAGLNGPAILVGHSYGGVVITEAGTAPNVAGLVYITAFAPDRGESVSSLIKDPPPGAPVPPIPPPKDGFLFLDKEKLAASFAADVKPEVARSWRPLRFHGGCRLWMAPSRLRPGSRSRAGTWSRPATR